MTTLAEHIMVTGAEIRPPMLEKSMYDSWASRIRLFIKGKKNGRMMLDSIDNGLLVYPTVEENRQARPKKYYKLAKAQQLQDDCDVHATNIILQSIPPDVYALVNHQEAAKDIWDRILLADQWHAYYWDDDAASLSLYQVSECSSTRMKQVCSSMYPPLQQFTPVYAEPIHHQHHHTPVNPQQQSVSPQTFIFPSVTQQSQAEFPQLDSGLVVPTFRQGEDLIECINKAMAFLFVVASRFTPLNNQLSTSSNPRNQATIQDGRVTVQQVQGRQTQSFVGTGNRGIATTSRRNYAAGQEKVVKCYNCLGEGYIAKQCTQPKRPRNFAWFKEKLMLVEPQEAGQILDEEQLAFIADPGIAEVQVAQQTIPYNSAFQTKDLDAYDSDSGYQQKDQINQCQMTKHEQEWKDCAKSRSKVQNMAKVRVYTEESSVNTWSAELKITNECNLTHPEWPKSSIVKEKESLSTTLTVFKTESKEKESKYIDKEIVLENQNKELKNILSLGYQNPFHLKKAQRIKPTLYDGSVIAKEHDVVCVIDDEETLTLEEESRSKMLDKQNDLILIKQKINISLIDYSKLNKIKEDFGKRFVTQKELSTEQAFWLKHSNYNLDTSVKSRTPIRIEASSELPKVSLVNESLKKLKYQLASFDKVVKKRTTSDNDSSMDILNVNKSCVDECNKCLELETELLKKKDLIEKDVYDKLLKSYSTLEKHCISLELITQLNQEIFQKENFRVNQNAPTFNQLFEINKLKAQSEEKYTVIRKLKDRIKSLIEKDSVKNVKKDIDEIETINIELEHTLKNELRKLKGKNVVNTAVSKPIATIAPGMFKLDIEPISRRLKNNRNSHEELLVYVSKTCPSLTKPCEKLAVVTPRNKDKKVRFVEPVTSSSNIPKQTGSLKTKDSTKPLLTSTRVNTTTSDSGSKRSGNTKKNKIS
ncbi:hypothetical protein Tco_1403051 [Tanacetum coccineum]